ncbi:xin actin-binding repeat-containing protein 2 isoform X1 [Protopterus annectens]|uniref:xin actin-binding repeat-containing protein 2 isoform X1 n=2 Tax=Protopterus annectens TaxID=7888 RepID=UPI001CF97984|nr:xin actin-binding repeat-containing protein 2 isoform X1 [Protopterus annectens]
METEAGNRRVMEEVGGKESTSFPNSSQEDVQNNEVFKEDLRAARRIEKFDIPLDNLKMMFEKTSTTSVLSPKKVGKKEAKVTRSTLSLTSPQKSQPEKHPTSSSGETGYTGRSASTGDMSFDADQNSRAPDSVDLDKSGSEIVEEAESLSCSVPPDLLETVPLKQRMAMYQGAVLKKESHAASSSGMDESDICTLPGGLASVKKQFEIQETGSSHSTVSQYQYQHKSVQEVKTTSEVIVHHTISSEHKENVPPSVSQFSTAHTEKASVVEHSSHQSNMASSSENQLDVRGAPLDEEIPKVSTQILKQQFEKTAKENIPQSNMMSPCPIKEAKPEKQFQKFEASDTASTSASTSTSKIYEYAKHDAKTATSSAGIYSANSASLEEFPPPPPDLLQTPNETMDYFSSPEPSVSPTKQILSKDVYAKQRNLYELKRLYKHIHPEVRKNLERNYFEDVTEMVSAEDEIDDFIRGEVQKVKYVFENTEHSPQKCMSPEREYLEWDEILKGEVQSMRWMFENQPLDSIKDESPDQIKAKGISQQEIIAGGDVKYTTWMFETQPIDTLTTHVLGPSDSEDKVPDLARGDVRTATWLFETQPLDSLNKIYQEGDQSSVNSTINDIAGGNVKTVKYLFETQHLDSIQNVDSVEEKTFLMLKSELEEIKGDVKKTTKLFETQPLYVIRDNSGQVLEIKTVSREDIEKGDVRTARWMFETQPLDMINKDTSQVKVVCGISMENAKGDVNKAKWLFETHSLDTIKDETETTVREKEAILGADVRRQCWIFETQPWDVLKDNSNAKPVSTDEIIGGDVHTAKFLFETIPMDTLKDSSEVGNLNKVVASEEEKGDVRHQKWLFETQPLDHIREDKKEYIKTVKLEETEKGYVSDYKHAFETMDLSKHDQGEKIQIEGVVSGAVKSNKALFESSPLYAIQDSAGKYHEVKTVRREEILRGDVRTCKWMFETKPIDQFDESIQKFQIIKGISKEEIQAGDVKTAKWLFETQPLDSIKYFSNAEDMESEANQTTEIVKGDVQTCRWLFETQPIESLYEKTDTTSNIEEIHKGDVKTCTWLFETQPLDMIRDDSENTIKIHTVSQEDIQGRDVQLARFLFETENLDHIQGEEGKEFGRVTEVDIQSGDVSRMKYIFENQSLDKISSNSEEMLIKMKAMQKEDIQKGNVLNCTWLFENHPIDAIAEDVNEQKCIRSVTDIQGGNVGKGCFIFETFSLDQIKDGSFEANTASIICRDEHEKGNVKNYTLLFETQPLYAIQDKEGHYHEVTTVRKEEVMSGDVLGTRWLFETKPLDSFNETDEVYVIKAVTQEDIQKGDVSTARWRFETQALDKISEEKKIIHHTVDDVQGGDVKANKQLFESEEHDQSKYVRTVSVSEIQKGDVRTATWLFETHTVNDIRGDSSDYKEIKTVKKEDVLKGDVQQSIWLFEKQPLDTIKDSSESETYATAKEEVPHADVKTTTWLFETTPFHEFNESKVERQEILGKNIKQTLHELYGHKVIQSHGIIIEADEVGDVRMAKYKLMNQETPEIQREDLIQVNLQQIIMELLSKTESTERTVLINEEEKGNVNSTIDQLLNSSIDYRSERQEVLKGDIQQAIESLFNEDSSVKKGILIQEDERGDVKMTIYSLLNAQDTIEIPHDEIIRGDIKRTIYSLMNSAQNRSSSEKCKIDESERGNVQFYTTCIESGALDYLKLLQQGSDETLEGEKQDEEIIGGDVEGTKLMLRKQHMQVERTVTDADILPGDVSNTVKIFMTEPQAITNNNKEEVVKGDLKTTLEMLSQSANQTAAIEKEEIVKADITATLKMLEEAKQQVKEIEKPEVIPGDIKRSIQSLEKAVTSKGDVFKKDIVHTDLEATLKSLSEAQNVQKEIEKEEIIKGDIQTTMQSLLHASTEKKSTHHQVTIQGDVRATIQSQSEDETHDKRSLEKESIPKVDTQATTKNPTQVQGLADHHAIFADTGKKYKRHMLSPKHKSSIPVYEKVDDVIKHDIQEKVKFHAEQLEGLTSDTSSALKKVTKKENVGKSETSKISSMSSVQRPKEQSIIVSPTHTELSPGTHKTKGKPILMHQSEVTQQMTVSSETYQPKKSKNISHSNAKTVTETVKETHSPKKQVGKNAINVKEKESQQSVDSSLSKTEVFMSNKKQELRSSKEVHETKIKPTPKYESTKQNIKAAVSGIEKSKMEAGKRNIKSQEITKKEVNPVIVKKEKTEIHFPPPPPSPPPSLHMFEADLPLPPPPPPSLDSDVHLFASQTHIEERKYEHESFPPPPPPVDGMKPETEFLAPPLPPPPPPSPAVTELLQKTESYAKSQTWSEKQAKSLPQLSKKVPAGKQIVKPSKIPQAKTVSKPDFLKSVEKANTKDSFDAKADSLIAFSSKEALQTVSHEITTEVMHSVALDTKKDDLKQHDPKHEMKQMKVDSQTLQSSSQPQLPKPISRVTQQETTLVKKAVTSQTRLPSPTVEMPQMKSKTYVRKFKTPLMIAEENYRKQREEAEKMKTKVSYSMSENVQESEESTTHKEFEGILPAEEIKDMQSSKSDINSSSTLSREILSTQVVKQAPEKKVSEQQPLATLVVSSAAEQLEGILKTCSEKKSTKEDIVQSFKHFTEHIDTCEKEHTYVTEHINTTQPIKPPEQSAAHKIKTISPKLKVKTVKLPVTDQNISLTKEHELQKKLIRPIQGKTSTIQQSEEKQIGQMSGTDDLKQDVIAEYQHKLTSKGEQLVTETIERKLEVTSGHKASSDKIYNLKGKEQVCKKISDEKEYRTMLPKQEVIKQDEVQIHGQQINMQKEQKNIIHGKQEQSKEVHKKVDMQNIVKENEKHINAYEQRGVAERQTQQKIQSKTKTKIKDDATSKVSNEREVPLKTASLKDEISVGQHHGSEQKQNARIEEKDKIDIVDKLRQRAELQQILSRLKEYETGCTKATITAMNIFLSGIPTWLLDKEEHMDILHTEGSESTEKIKEKLEYIRNKAKTKLDYIEEAIQNVMVSKTVLKPEKESSKNAVKTYEKSKISCDLDKQSMQKKCEIIEEKIIQHETKHRDFQTVMQTEQRSSSPSLKMRSPSPTYITIESVARRAESSQGTSASPTPHVQREATPPPPPPRRSETPVSRVHRSSTSPSPTRSRTEQLAKLKDTTAKLSQGASQNRPPTPVQVTEKKSEIIQSPASLRRQLKIESHVIETASTATAPVSDSEITYGLVKDIKEIFEEARRTEENRTYGRKTPIDIPERLGPDNDEPDETPSKQTSDMPKIDLSELVDKFEKPREKLYGRKEPFPVNERLASDSEEDIEKKQGNVDQIPTFDLKSVRSKFESTSQRQQIKPEKKKVGAEQKQLISDDNKSLQDLKGNYYEWHDSVIKEDLFRTQTSPQMVHKKISDTGRSSPLHSYSERRSAHEQSAGSAKQRSQIAGSHSATAISSRGGEPTANYRYAPPSYEDVISGHMLDISADESTEELLRNFQRTWQESERVFKSLGYKVSDSDETIVQSSFHQEGTFMTEDASTRQGTLHTLPKDSLPYGMSGSRQADLS